MSWDANVDIVIGFIGFSTSNILSWLVVWTILKTMSQWEGWHPIYEMENKIHVPKHQPDIKIIKPCNNSKLTIGDSVGLGLPHLGFFTKKGNRETHWFHQWFSLCFTHWISGCKKNIYRKCVLFISIPKYMQLFFHNPILGRKTLW